MVVICDCKQVTLNYFSMRHVDRHVEIHAKKWIFIEIGHYFVFFPILAAILDSKWPLSKSKWPPYCSHCPKLFFYQFSFQSIQVCIFYELFCIFLKFKMAAISRWPPISKFQKLITETSDDGLNFCAKFHWATSFRLREMAWTKFELQKKKKKKKKRGKINKSPDTSWSET